MSDADTRRGRKPYNGVVSPSRVQVSSNGKRRHAASPAYVGKQTLSQPGDEQVGEWPRSRLIKMDNRFRARLLAAFERGKESREAAANRIPTPLW
jgi:hypothetical protein